MQWRDPIDHETNCYICLTNILRYNRKNFDKIKYANVTSVTKPVPHSDNLPIPTPPETDGNVYMDTDDEIEDQQFDIGDPLYIPDTKTPHALSQGDFNDLVRDLSLTKELSELLASRLQEWKLLETGR